jgi:serine/threonine protein phosphatase 1
MKTFALSDIHGCYDELMALVARLPLEPERDRVVFLGDYVDRGPDSRRVVEQVIDWAARYPHWVFLQGNHEDELLNALQYGGRVHGWFDLWYRQGGRETLRSYLPQGWNRFWRHRFQAGDVIPEAHLAWLAARPRYFEDDAYIYVHAGLKPGKTPQETDPQDLIWIRDEFLDSDYDWGKKVIHGHTPTWHSEPDVRANRINIDTGLCYSPRNKLTAIELPAERFSFQPSLAAVPNR